MSTSHDRFGDLRAALAGPRTLERFHDVCAILDGWPEDDSLLMEAVLPYTLEALTGWDEEVRQATPQARAEVLSGQTPWSLALVATARYGSVPIHDLSSFLDAHRPETLRRLTLKLAEGSDAQVEQLVTHPVTPGLTHLRLVSGWNTRLSHLIGSERLANLESLDLRMSSLMCRSIHVNALMIATHFERLRCLRLPGSFLDQDEVGRLVQASFFPGLEALDVSLRVESEELATLLDHMDGLDLRALDLTLYEADDDAIALLASRLPAGVRLQLFLTEATLHGGDLEHIEGLISLELFDSSVDQVAIASLTRCDALESLQFQASECSLLHAMEGLSGLRRLELKDVGVSDGDLTRWCLSGAAPDLEELVVSGGGLTEETLLGAMTWPRPRIARLALLEPEVGSAPALARLLESGVLPGLEQLTLLKGGERWGAAPLRLDALERELDAAHVMGVDPLGELGGAGDAWERAERAARERGVELRADLRHTVWSMQG